MVGMIKVKIRNIGSSAGVIIPQINLIEAGAKVGDEVEIAIFSKKKKDISTLFGIGKDFKIPFERDKTVRDFE